MAGLEIVFDASFDGGAWPGPLAASFGEAWLGPQGLLSRLELELGLGARHPTPLERAVDLTRTLGRGYWSASFEVDPIATARRLLDDRDTLVSWGWTGQPASARLASLWDATSAASPGIPDRVRCVIEHVAHGHVDVATIAFIEPIENRLPIWRSLFHALERHGVRTVLREPQPSTVVGDLGAARASGFVPRGDGTLQLFRPYGALAAADEIAGTIAASSGDSSTLIIGPDAVLDAALARHGVPRVGADMSVPASAALLRACIETAFHPTDTAELHALICADPGPVPRNVAWGLVGALRKFAGRGSDAWRDALVAQLAVLDADARDAIASRLASLLDPLAPRDGVIAMHALEARMHALATWARGRDLLELATRTEQLVQLLHGADHVSRAELLRLCDELERTVVPSASAEAGLHTVIVPGAMVGPAATVIWWGFTRDRAPVPPRLRLSNAERAALGAVVPDFGAMMAHEARLWRRPLELAAHSLVLVCPRTDSVGDPTHPHPLWDELVATMPEAALRAHLEVEHPMLPGGILARHQRARPRPLPQPFTVAHAPVPLALRDVESASSIEQLLGCSLAYVLRYRGRLRPRLSAPPVEPSPLLYGNVAHHVLALVFASGSLPPDEAAVRANALLDFELPRIAETLLLPDRQAERAMVRCAIVDSARLVAILIQHSRARLRGLEVPLAGKIGTTSIAGRADLVLEAPDHVLDFKWGTASHRDQLRTGAAVQLAIYAALLRAGSGASFLSVRDQRLLAARGSGLPMAIEPGDHTIDEMLAGVHAAIDDRIAELALGQLVAPGAMEDAPRSRLVDRVLRLAPSCNYCELGTLCGRRGHA
ncbi:MAG TPA: PD-(D/E)XK nuclease family protein [Kofleriaceae bacterium]|nr:PD-(D/E)XK nuclease family protein [Kofleriaceae bacterium]